MFELTVTDEFERWFGALGESEAEQVTAALDLVGEAGPTLDPVKASRLLLWYDGMVQDNGPCQFAVEWQARVGASAVDSLRALMLWQRQVVRCLESPAVLSRLDRLDPASAARALDAVERIKNRVRALRTQISIGTFLPRQGERTAPAASGEDAVKRALEDVLRSVGLCANDCVDAASGLRELTIATEPVRLRVIYGIDVPRRRVLVLLGEALDRTYYGDSVRWAEARWRAYNIEPLEDQAIRQP
jgi:hypothetical protein